MSQGRWIRVVAVGAGVVLLLCCSAGVSLAGDDSGPKSNTPHVGSGTHTLDAGLLRLSDVRALPGVPSDIQRTPTRDAQLFGNPDPRGPCGAKVDQPNLTKGSNRVFTANALGLFEVVLRVTPRAQRFIDASVADATPTCPPYTSRTNTGTTQHVQSVVVPLPGVGEQSVGATATIRVSGQTAYVGEIVLRRGTNLAVVIMVAALPINAETVQAAAAVADARLVALAAKGS